MLIKVALINILIRFNFPCPFHLRFKYKFLSIFGNFEPSTFQDLLIKEQIRPDIISTLLLLLKSIFKVPPKISIKNLSFWIFSRLGCLRSVGSEKKSNPYIETFNCSLRHCWWMRSCVIENDNLKLLKTHFNWLNKNKILTIYFLLPCNPCRSPGL